MNRVFPNRPAILSACAVMGLSVSALAADIAITDLAPKDSFLVVSIDDYAQMRAAFDRTGFKEIWTDPGVQKWFDRQAEQFLSDFEQMLDDLGLEQEDLKSPKGMAGGAMWLTMNEENELHPHMIIAADYADEAQAMHDVMVRVMDEGVERDRITLDEEEYAGVTIYQITPLEVEDEEGDVEAEEWEWEDDGGMFDLEDEEIYYARAGEMILYSSNKRALENSIDRIETGKVLATIDENPDYARSLAQIGRHHMSASFLVSPMLDAMKRAEEAAGEEMDDEFAMMMPDPMMLMDVAGITAVKAVSFGVNFDADAGMLEQTWSIICPEKRGMIALLDNPPATNTPPAFVTSDATSFTSFQFRFADLLPKVREMAETLPEEMGQQVLQGLGMAEQMIGPVLAQLDPQMVIAQSYTRPFAPDSQKMLVAIKAKDQAALSDAVVGLVNSGMVPLQSRDFLGNTIWEVNPAMGMGEGQFALGLGSGHMFIGQTTEIENALRAAGAEGSSLAEDEDFQAAAKAVGTSGLGFTFTDMRTTIEYLDWTMRNYEKIVRAEFSGPEWQDDPDMKEFAEEMIQDALENMPAWMQDAPPLDVIIRNIGDMAGQMKSTPDGFIMRSVVLRPNK